MKHDAIEGQNDEDEDEDEIGRWMKRTDGILFLCLYFRVRLLTLLFRSFVRSFVRFVYLSPLLCTCLRLSETTMFSLNTCVLFGGFLLYICSPLSCAYRK